MKLKLPSVTLVCVDCVDANRAIKVIEHCKNLCDFGDVKLLTSTPSDYQHAIKIHPLNSLVSYSVFMLTNIHHYIDTPHLLVVQRDGWILNPESWDPAWLELDYIGPLFVQYDKVGSGGFSLRKRSIMWEISKLVQAIEEWDGSQQHADEIQSSLQYYEDGVICLGRFANRFKIGTPEQAANFAAGGNRNPKYFREFPFGFHRTFQQIDFTTGRVDSSDLSRDLSPTYNHEIDAL